MDTGSWEIALVAAKWLVLLATAGMIGGAFTLALARRLHFPAGSLRPVHLYLLKCGLWGLLGNLLWFLLQIGSINRNGFGGMFDKQLFGILLQTGVGEAWQTRMFGFVVATAVALRPATSRLPQWPESLGYVAAGLLLIAAFSDTGHVSTLHAGARVALAVHALGICLWVGSLYPLLQLCRAPDLAQLQQLMRSFGTQALAIVAVLVLAGVYLAAQLLQAPAELLTTTYGRVLLLKLLGVYALLMFAAINKFMLVPRLANGGGPGALQSSIRMEWIVALLVLAATSWMTTIVGPAGD